MSELDLSNIPKTDDELTYENDQLIAWGKIGFKIKRPTRIPIPIGNANVKSVSCGGKGHSCKKKIENYEKFKS